MRCVKGALALGFSLFCAALGSAEGPGPSSSPGPSLIPIPYVFSSPETGFAGGVMLMVVDSSDPGSEGQPDNVYRGGGFYSAKGQMSGFLTAEHYLRGTALRLGLEASIARFPDRFYGLGPSVGGYETYDPLELRLDAAAGFLLAPHLYLGPRLLWYGAELLEREPGGLLEEGGYTGGTGARVVSPGFRLTYEGRDSSIAATRGWFLDLSGGYSSTSLGASSSFFSAGLDARGYVQPLPGYRAVLAGQVCFENCAGDPPFEELPELGGDSLLRGYYQGKYRDKSLVAAQVELRLPLWRFIGVVLYAGAGQVGSDPLALRLDSLKLAAGAGLRFVLDKKSGAALRADLAWGEGEPEFYLNLGETF